MGFSATFENTSQIITQSQVYVFLGLKSFQDHYSCELN